MEKTFEVGNKIIPNFFSLIIDLSGSYHLFSVWGPHSNFLFFVLLTHACSCSHKWEVTTLCLPVQMRSHYIRRLYVHIC